MKLKTRLFKLCKEDRIELADLAKTMSVSLNYISKIEKGGVEINKRFIIKSIKAFPGYKISDLFYLDN